MATTEAGINLAPFSACTLSSSLGTLHFSALTLSQLDAINQLEQTSSRHPWSRSNLESSLCNSHRGLGLILGDQLIAHAFISLASVEAELLLITVAKAYQGRGLGGLFLTTIIEQLEGQAEDLFLEVRPSNQAAVGLYETLGFNQLGVRKGYYPGPNGGEDAWVYGLSIFAN
ncbi:MAG TPA: ribosomal protein S18-alanine N-acetyltransferase [Cellvibrionaceae bacterium]